MDMKAIVYENVDDTFIVLPDEEEKFLKETFTNDPERKVENYIRKEITLKENTEQTTSLLERFSVLRKYRQLTELQELLHDQMFIGSLVRKQSRLSPEERRKRRNKNRTQRNSRKANRRR
jgi:hypothetical protein